MSLEDNASGVREGVGVMDQAEVNEAVVELPVGSGV